MRASSSALNMPRLCVGVAKVRLNNGETEGRRAEPFDYSGKILLSKKQYDANARKEILCVKSLAVGAD